MTTLETAPGAATLDDRLDALAGEVAWIATEMRAQQAAREQLTELASELSLVAGPVMAGLTARLTEAEAKGWFAFARQGGAIADRVVTSFSEDDVKALGDNVVLILETVREMTRPEVMGMLRRTALTAQHADETYAEPPSTLALLRQLRDPEVRRGLARTISVLRTVGAQPADPIHPEGE